MDALAAILACPKHHTHHPVLLASIPILDSLLNNYEHQEVVALYKDKKVLHHLALIKALPAQEPKVISEINKLESALGENKGERRESMVQVNQRLSL